MNIHCDSGKSFNFSRDLAGPHDHTFEELMDETYFKVKQHHTKSGSHRRYGSRDIMVLVCHMISQDYLIKVSCHFMGRSASKKVIIW